MTEQDKNYIERQSAFLFQRGVKPEELQSLLKEKLGEQYQASGDDPLQTKEKHREPVIRRLIEAAEDMSVNLNQILLAVSKLKYDVKVLSRPARQIFSDLINYLVAVSVVMIIIIYIFSSSLAPQFESMFAAFDRSLPYLTQLVFRSGLKVILIILPIVLIVLTVMLNRTVRNIYQLKIDTASWMLYTPILSRLVRTYYSRLYVEIYPFLRALAGNHDDLLERSRKIVLGDNHELLGSKETSIGHISRCLQGADELGTLEQEVDYWRDRLDIELSTDLSSTREKLTLLVNFVMGILVGIVVIAIYLPIFKMGAAV